MSNVTVFPGGSGPTVVDENRYTVLLRTDGRELAASVAAIANGLRTDLIADDDRSRLVIALTLLAAGLPLPLVATTGSSLRAALDVLAAGSGPEFFLLDHGLTVSHFHALRERLDDAGVTGHGDAA